MEGLVEIQSRIRRLKQEQNAIILAHNYQLPEVQDIADVVGDSLGLARAAARTDADLIVFCGVHFMAETAAILNPGKRVLLPDLEAGCSLADTITADQLRAWKREHPGAVVVAYINTSAEVKAECDYCCTSSNAVKVVESIPADREILFLPDMFLGNYVQRTTGRPMQIWMGECHVHAGIDSEQLSLMQRKHPEAELLIHPECGCSTSAMFLLSEGMLDEATSHILSTGAMLEHARASRANQFLVATEVGILHRLEGDNPDKQFIPVSRTAICKYMKQITLPKVLESLTDHKHVISVPPHIAQRALGAIERMIAIG